MKYCTGLRYLFFCFVLSCTCYALLGKKDRLLVLSKELLGKSSKVKQIRIFLLASNSRRIENSQSALNTTKEGEFQIKLLRKHTYVYCQ